MKTLASYALAEKLKARPKLPLQSKFTANANPQEPSSVAVPSTRPLLGSKPAVIPKSSSVDRSNSISKTSKASLPFHKQGSDFHITRSEAVVLSALINMQASAEVFRKLSPVDFYSDGNKAIFDGCVRLYNEGKAISPEALVKYLQDSDPDFVDDWRRDIEGHASVQVILKDLEGHITSLLRASSIRTSGKTVLPKSFSESATAELMIARLKPIKCVKTDWYEYDEGVWTKKVRDIFRPIAADVIVPGHREMRRVSDVLGLVESMRQVSGASFCGAYKEIANGSILVNTGNCTLVIEQDGSVTSRAFSMDDMFTVKLATNYNPSAECTRFIDALQAALPDVADRELLQAFAGYILMPNCNHEVALTCYGEGGTGKSTIIGVLRDVLGVDACGSCGLEELCHGSGYSLPTLKFKMMNLASELQGTEIEASASFKKLVSGEPMTTREIYKSPEDMKTTCKQVFLTNHLPQFKRGSNAEERRLRLLHFKVKPSVPDIGLKDALIHEKSGILNWMLAGLAKLLQTKEMPMGGNAAKKLANEFHKRNDPVKAFFDESCALAPNSEVEKSEILGEFCDWHGSSREKMESMFFKRLRELYPQLEDSRPNKGGRRVRCIKGLLLR